jgi:hypothetical protein
MPSRHLRSTSTITHDGRAVPWLAADGPLSYSPEEPPDRDYFFRYGRVVPGIFAEKVNKRRHYYFGASHKDDARELLSFWEGARAKGVERVALCLGRIEADEVTAPAAVYVAPAYWRGPAYLLVQHGSYQFVRVRDQPELERGTVLLYRGVQKTSTFRFLCVGELHASRRTTWRRYLAVQAHVLSDATLSFNSIHDRAKRSETEHIRDRSWMSDDLARQYGVDIERERFANILWNFTHESFALARWVAEHKFGPNYVVCKTPLTNIRMTTFFAGEHEARIVDPRCVEVVEAHGCAVEHVG